ncbi:MAG: 50S ribosomal protein L9 [Geminicoccaceae bacterium]|nr:50S ribosomal protein L9 [Geminicoccaceae bacterium]
MQVILLERVPKLGQMGQVVKVRSGFARNFLIPQGKALRATDEAQKAFEQRRQQFEARNLERRSEAEAAAKDVEGKSVVIVRQASENRQLYGSVGPRDVAEAFTASGVSLDRGQIRLESPIKTTGIHEVAVALHPEVEVKVSVNVARTQEEADIQAGRAAPVVDDTLNDEDALALEEGVTEESIFG